MIYDTEYGILQYFFIDIKSYKSPQDTSLIT